MKGGRYNGKSNDDMNVYLKGYSGDSIATSRVSRSGLALGSPALSMCIAVQPYVLEHAILDGENIERGIVGRLCLAVCDDKAGWREAVSKPVPEPALASYEKLIGMLFSCSTGYEGEPEKLAMSDKAKEYAVYWHDCIAEPQIAEAPRELKAWFSKREGLAYRIMGISHAVQCI